MKIALFSPVNPVVSGISDYTEEMLPAFTRHLELDLYHHKNIKPSNRELVKQINFIPYDKDKFVPSDYDEIIYHMGNYYSAHCFIYEALKTHPGIVVLHDFVLQGFYAERFKETKDFDAYVHLEKTCYGKRGEEIAWQIKNQIPPPIWDTEKALDFPLNEEVVEHAKAIVVHSDFVKGMIQEKATLPVKKIYMHGQQVKSFDTKKIRKGMGIGPEDILLCSAGFINKNKRFETIFKALSELEDDRLKFVIAGRDRGGLISGLLEDYSFDVIRLDHLSLEDFEGLISASDICINLRYPTMGESSGSLLRMMGYGKPTLVTNFGSYREFPDYCVLKVDPDIDEKEMLKRYIHALLEEKDFRVSIGEEAKRFVEEECSIGKCVLEYVSFLKKQVSKEYSDEKKE